jgi:hypothetical protein
MMNLSEHTCARLARNVDWTMAARIDEGLARYAARTKCIFCGPRRCRSSVRMPNSSVLRPRLTISFLRPKQTHK